MTRLLVVGDPHAKVEDLADCQALISYIAGIADEQRPDAIVFLGDQNHHHSIVHTQVLQFWLEALDGPLKDFTVKMLVGNHDLAGNGDETCHSLAPFAHLKNVRVYQSPVVWEGVLFVPYMDSEEKFVKTCQEFSPDLAVLCHQTFNGSKYENGFYAKDGFDADKVPQRTLISGHIHTPQAFGKVWYPGSPRWQTMSDANVDRAVWLVEIQGGEVTGKRSFSTNHVCRQIIHVIDTPTQPYEAPAKSDHRVIVDIVGPAEYVERRKKELKAKGNLRIRTFPEDNRTIKVRESEGIAKAFQRFFDGYESRFGTSKSVLAQMVKEKLDVVVEAKAN